MMVDAEHLSTFKMLADLGLVLAGFAGVASAYGGRSRAYDNIDLNRLMVLFATAGAVFAGSLSVVALNSLGIENSKIFFAVSAVLSLVVGAAAMPLIRTGIANNRARPEVAPQFALAVGAIFLITFESILVLNVLSGRAAGPLIAALALALIYGLWIFVRLLTRPT